MRRAILAFLVAGLAQAGPLPAWWVSFPKLANLESDFLQESDSAVFGKLKREGRIQLARGGRIRVQYSSGLLLVADGTSLVQYDPAVRTAQRMAIRASAADMPLLNLLLDPRSLDSIYRITSNEPNKVLLDPRRQGIPSVSLEAKGGFLSQVSWTDATGAKQVLTLKNPKTPSGVPPATTFQFKAPEGTRWIGGE